jgi:tetratricopeptide (TPR) repeat protein
VVFETLAELGLLGFAILAAFFGCVIAAAVRRVRAPDAVPEVAPALAVLAIGLAAAAVDWTWDLPAVFGIAVVVAALLTGPATLSGPDPGPPVRQPRGEAGRRRSFAAGVAVLLIAWISICACGLLLLSAHSLESSRDAAGRADLEAAIDAANDAINLQPWAAEPRTQLALVYEQGGDLERARETMAEAIARAPEDYRLRLLAARMAFAANQSEEAREDLEEAHRLNPRDPTITEQIEALGRARSPA